MSKTEQIDSLIEDMSKKKPIRTYTILFVLLLVGCFSTFFRKGLLPIYKIDGLGQYYPAFMYIGKILREGHMRFYDLSVGMGEDIFGTLNYYGFGDPVNILSVFATESTGPYIFSLIYFVRLFLGGICFMLYCRRFFPASLAGVFSSLSYVFWGYGLFASAMYPQYAAMLYVLPLLLTGCEMTLKKERSPILFLTSLYLGLCGFYFTYICVLFLIVYCAVRSLFIYGHKDLFSALKRCMICALEFLLGICCSLPVLLPSLFAFLSSNRGASSVAATLFNYTFYLPSLDRSFVSDANIMNSIRNYPVMLSAVALFLLPANKRNKQLRILVVSLLVLLYLPITARAFNGFADARDRWVFEAQLCLCIVFASVSDALSSDERYKKRMGAVYAAVFVNIIISFWGLYSGMGKDMKTLYAGADEVRNEMSSPVTLSAVIKDDGSLYRVSGDFRSDINDRPQNIAMLAGYNGMTYWFSIVNENTQKYVDEVTGISNDWRSYGFGDDIKAETKAGVKYRFVKDGNVPAGYDHVDSVILGDTTWEIYENPDFASFARIVDVSGNTVGECADCSYDTNVFTCRLSGGLPEGADSVITAIPYANGWSAFVDEKKIETHCNGHFLAVSASDLSDDDVIRFEYVSPGFYTGLWICGTSLTVYILYCLFCFIKRKKTTEQQ